MIKFKPLFCEIVFHCKSAYRLIRGSIHATVFSPHQFINTTRRWLRMAILQFFFDNQFVQIVDYEAFNVKLSVSCALQIYFFAVQIKCKQSRSIPPLTYHRSRWQEWEQFYRAMRTTIMFRFCENSVYRRLKFVLRSYFKFLRINSTRGIIHTFSIRIKPLAIPLT